MRHIARAVTAVAAVGAAAAIALPATADAATPTAATSTGSAQCATFSSFHQVQQGQTVAQVQQEMGSAGTSEGMMTKQGVSSLELSWNSCSALGLVQFGVDFHANPNQPLTVLGKSALPRTSLAG